MRKQHPEKGTHETKHIINGVASVELSINVKGLNINDSALYLVVYMPKPIVKHTQCF